LQWYEQSKNYKPLVDKVKALFVTNGLPVPDCLLPVTATPYEKPFLVFARRLRVLSLEKTNSLGCILYRSKVDEENFIFWEKTYINAKKYLCEGENGNRKTNTGRE